MHRRLNALSWITDSWTSFSCQRAPALFTATMSAQDIGCLALFIRFLNGESADNILTADFGFLAKTGLKEHLAPTRANALNLMAGQMKQRALEFALKK